MNGPRAAKRRSAGIASAKVLITSASIAATLGGWAAIGASADPATGLTNSTASDSPPLADSAAPVQRQAPPDQQPSGGANPWPQQQDGSTSPWPQGSFGDRRRHRGEWTPNGGFGGQPPAPGAPDLGQSQPPDQAAPDTPNANPAPAPSPPQLQPRARTRSSR